MLGRGAEDRRPAHLAETHCSQNLVPVKPHQSPPTWTQAKPTQAPPSSDPPAPDHPLPEQSNPPPPPSDQALSSLSSPEPLNNLSLDAPPHQPSHSLTTDNLATLQTSSRASTVLGGGDEDGGEGGGSGGGSDGGEDGGGCEGGEDARGEDGGSEDSLTTYDVASLLPTFESTAVVVGEGGEDGDGGRQRTYSGGLGAQAQEEPLTFVAVEQTLSPPETSQPETGLPHNKADYPPSDQAVPATNTGLASPKPGQAKLRPSADFAATTHPKPSTSQHKVDVLKSKLSQSAAPSLALSKAREVVVRPQIAQVSVSSPVQPSLLRDLVTPSPEHEAPGMRVTGTYSHVLKVCMHGNRAKDPFRGAWP